MSGMRSAAKPAVSLSRWQSLQLRAARWRRWEFWPGWLFYLPIVAWIIVLGLRHRHWTAFTACNPGMDNGSVVGERKSRTLLALQERLPHSLPATRLLPTDRDAALDQVDNLADQHGWPLVLKPDIGQRGRGVAIIQDRAAAERYLRRANFAVLAQSYIGGEEYGVFVQREYPEGPVIISSVTFKHLPCLRGDGSRTLAELILSDARGRLLAPQLWQQWAEQLHQIPAANERVPMAQIGAHCRGAEFRSAQHLRSAALRDRMQEICDAIPGFDFGRIDLRCPDAKALREGRGLQLLEINGVTSEPAHVYHPDTPYWQGLRCFAGHWTQAFRLGHLRLSTGSHHALSPWRLLQLFRTDLRRFADCEAAATAANAAHTQT